MGSDILALLPHDEADQERSGGEELFRRGNAGAVDSDETDKIVELFADKIPHTHGAPVRAAAGLKARTQTMHSN